MPMAAGDFMSLTANHLPHTTHLTLLAATRQLLLAADQKQLLDHTQHASYAKRTQGTWSTNLTSQTTKMAAGRPSSMDAQAKVDHLEKLLRSKVCADFAIVCHKIARCLLAHRAIAHLESLFRVCRLRMLLASVMRPPRHTN